VEKNRVKEILRKEKGIAYGTVAQSCSPEGAEIAARAGLDFIIVDTEHTYFGLETSVNHFRAIEAHGATPIIRLPDDDPIAIAKALDSGAQGILIPLVSTKEKAESIVRATRYAPKGDRGMCPSCRATGQGLTPWQTYRKWSEEEVLVIALIETVEGVKNIDEICQVEGLDVIALGPYDLSGDMGLNAQVEHPDVIANLIKVAETARRNGKDVLAFPSSSSPEQLKKAVDFWEPKGVRLFNYSCDTGAMVAQYGYVMASIKSWTK